MRKRLMNISKRCMVAIMSAAFIMSSVTVSMAFPVGVYAEDNSESNVTIDSAIDTNTGAGVTVSESGSVGTNSGSIIENYGTVEENVNDVISNKGTVTTNIGDIAKNYGTVSHNRGIIIRSFDGTVTNEEGGSIRDQYYSVTLSNDSNITAEYGAGFTVPIVVDTQGNRKQFIQVTEDTLPRGDAASGQITISPKENYKITGRDTEEVTQSSDSTFYYELREDGGKYYLTIINPTKALTIDPTTLGLVISRIQNEENVSIANVIVEDLVYTYDSSNDGDQSEPSGNVTPVIKNTTQRMFDGKNIYLNNSVYEMYYRYQSNMTWDEFDLLCSTDNDIPKNCYFTIGGRLYVLNIPAIDTGSETYKSCLDELKKRPNGLEGPAEIANIFKNLGITCTDMTANQPEAKETRIASTVNRSANTMDQIAIKATVANEAAIIDEIKKLPPAGGKVSILDLAQTGLSASVVQALIANNDAPITLIYITDDGRIYQLVIPAGFNLLTLNNGDGGVDFATLLGVFKASAVG